MNRDKGAPRHLLPLMAERIIGDYFNMHQNVNLLFVLSRNQRISWCWCLCMSNFALIQNHWRTLPPAYQPCCCWGAAAAAVCSAASLLQPLHCPDALCAAPTTEATAAIVSLVSCPAISFCHYCCSCCQELPCHCHLVAFTAAFPYLLLFFLATVWLHTHTHTPLLHQYQLVRILFSYIIFSIFIEVC